MDIDKRSLIQRYNIKKSKLRFPEDIAKDFPICYLSREPSPVSTTARISKRLSTTQRSGAQVRTILEMNVGASRPPGHVVDQSIGPTDLHEGKTKADLNKQKQLKQKEKGCT